MSRWRAWSAIVLPFRLPAAARPLLARAAMDWALWMSLALVGLWVALGADVNNAQWGDHFEQFVWAHSFEWGYYKHPPLPTWMLAAAIAIFGPWPYWTYALAGLCTAGTAFFTYRVAQRLIGDKPAALAILLWGLQQAFSARAQLFNHNTVMMLAISGTAWCVLRALDSSRRAWWIAAGVGAGLAMLSKYQSVVPLAGIGVALLLTGELARHSTRRGALMAIGVAAPVFAPHLLWMLQHDFSTLRYAAQEGRPLSWAARGLSVTVFLGQQIRLLFPAMLFAGVLWLLPGLRTHSHAATATDDDQAQWRRAWFAGLIVFPLVVTVLVCPAFGLDLKNHWGYQCLQFFSLWLAWRLQHLARRGAVVLATLALLVQSVFMTVCAEPEWTGQRDPDRRADGQYPARQLAAAVQRDWQAITSCPLTVVVGPSFEAGMVSVYSHAPPKVLEDGDFAKSPWVQPDELSHRGAVYVATDPNRLPVQGVALLNSMNVAAAARASASRIYWAIVPPRSCDPASAPSGNGVRSTGRRSGVDLLHSPAA